MYGMINQAVKDLVVSRFGTENWESICKKVGIQADDFVLMQYYPDKLTYELVGAAASQLSLSPEVVLKEFGKYWILYTAKEGYGPMMDLFGNDFKSCLKNLNHFHSRMGITMPNLTPPRFTFHEESPASYIVSYYSKRQGLSPMVIGLLEGLAAKYKIKIEIVDLQKPEDGAVMTMRINVLG